MYFPFPFYFSFYFSFPSFPLYGFRLGYLGFLRRGLSRVFPWSSALCAIGTSRGPLPLGGGLANPPELLDFSFLFARIEGDDEIIALPVPEPAADRHLAPRYAHPM